MITAPTIDIVREHVVSDLSNDALLVYSEAATATVNERAPDVAEERALLAVIQLTKLEILLDGESQITEGSWTSRRAFSGRERESVLRSLSQGRPARMVVGR